jgi:hypothetical protein
LQLQLIANRTAFASARSAHQRENFIVQSSVLPHGSLSCLPTIQNKAAARAAALSKTRITPRKFSKASSTRALELNASSRGNCFLAKNPIYEISGRQGRGVPWIDAANDRTRIVLIHLHVYADKIENTHRTGDLLNDFTLERNKAHERNSTSARKIDAKTPIDAKPALN